MRNIMHHIYMRARYIVLAALFLLQLIPFASAYNSTTDPSVMPMIIAMGISIATLLIVAALLAEKHSLVSVFMIGLAIFMINPLLQIGKTYLDGIEAVALNFDSIIIVLTWMDYALIVYILVYVMVKVISGYNQDKKERIEGLR